MLDDIYKVITTVGEGLYKERAVSFMLSVILSLLKRKLRPSCRMSRRNFLMLGITVMRL